MEEITVIQEVWKAGSGTRVVTIEKKVRNLLDIDYGDTLEIRIKRVKKADKTDKYEDKKQIEKDVERLGIFINNISKIK